jgi:hypothetical protein
MSTTIQEHKVHQMIEELENYLIESPDKDTPAFNSFSFEVDSLEALKEYERCLRLNALDIEIIPYLDRLLESFRTVVPVQSCIGHMVYEGAQPYKGVDSSKKITKWATRPEVLTDKIGNWGYLALYCRDFVLEREFAASNIDKSDWLLEPLSTLWIMEKWNICEPLARTQHGTARIGFAWEAKHWPQPAEDICKILGV